MEKLYIKPDISELRLTLEGVILTTSVPVGDSTDGSDIEQS